eukprot:UN02355
MFYGHRRIFLLKNVSRYVRICVNLFRIFRCQIILDFIIVLAVFKSVLWTSEIC